MLSSQDNFPSDIWDKSKVSKLSKASQDRCDIFWSSILLILDLQTVP